MDNIINEQKFFHCCGHKKYIFAPLVAAIILLLLALTVSLAVGTLNKVKQGKYIGKNPQSQNVITVSDTGDVYAKPDLGLVNVSVKNQAKTVAKAMQENTEKMNKVIEMIKKQGVEQKDLKTTAFNIYPQYDYVYAIEEIQIYPYPPGKRVLTGYEVAQSLEVKIRDLAKAGDIIQAATDSGANEVSDLVFTIENQDEVKKQARNEAIDKARSKAEELASELGVRLVRIISFSENAYYPYYFNAMSEKAVSSGAGGSAPQIETGENKTSITVSITYEIE